VENAKVPTLVRRGFFLYIGMKTRSKKLPFGSNPKIASVVKNLTCNATNVIVRIGNKIISPHLKTL
jgi:hypothetical protein